MNMDWILDIFPEYEIFIEYDNIEQKGDEQEVHGLNKQMGTRCLFCGTPFEEWDKKDVAHAISECMGNKKLINYCECYHCNHRFGEIAENHLGKYIMPYRIINEVYGKGHGKNIIKDISKDDTKSFETYRFEQRKNQPIFQSETFEVYSLFIEKHKFKLITPIENGVILTLPRQTYNPKMVYISFLKMAYTLLPFNEIPHYINNILSLYSFISDKPLYNQTEVVFDENKKDKYINGLPHMGLEICLTSDTIPNGVNVCLLKHTQKDESTPELIFAIQMKWHTIVIPILNDCAVSKNSFYLKYVQTLGSNIRELDFKSIEENLECDMSAVKIEIPKEFYPELEENLRKCKFLAKMINM